MAEQLARTSAPPKKSVALSGVTAGNTALCTVGRSGNDLHYRGYDILDVAETCEFEEIAHLLVHETLPTRAELAAYKAKLKALRGLPAAVRTTLEALPAAAHPMDVMRSGVSTLGCVLPESHDHNHSGARDIADRLMASLGSMLLYWHHFAHNGRRIDVETDDDSIGGHFLHLLHGAVPSEAHIRAMHTSLNLYAEHEFNASTFTARCIAGTGSDIYSTIAGAIGALRGPKHGGANEVAFEIQKRYASPDEAEADIRRRVAAKEVVIGFGHPVYTVADPRNRVIKDVARHLSADAGSMKMFDIADRIEAVMAETKNMFANLDWFSAVSYHMLGARRRIGALMVPAAVLERDGEDVHDHSIMYIFAVALEDGGWHHESSYTPARAQRPETVALWHRISTVEDPEWTRRYHSHDPREKAFGGKVVVTLNDGSVITDEIAVADAHPFGARPFRREQYIVKFRALMEGIVTAHEQDRFLGLIERLPKLKPDDLSGLTFTVEPSLLRSVEATGIFDWRGEPAGTTRSLSVVGE